jgi:hypothetical protein
LLDLVLLDSSISLEKLLSYDARTQPIVKNLNTRMFETILPDITKKWGAKRFDIMMSLSHNLLKTYLDGAKMTGFNIDKNGNFRFNFNIHF